MRSFRLRPAASVTALTLLLLGCANSDAKQVPGTAAAGNANASVTPSAGAPITPAKASVPGAGKAGKLTDSVSMRADAGRIRGSEAAPVWLIEISDFQCPYCKQWHDQTFATIDKEFVQTGQVRLAYLNFPIASLHPNAQAASEAAMCASVQGKFWEMHESLFNTQRDWATRSNANVVFDSLAVAAGVNAENWRSCVSSHATAPLIEADRERVGERGVQSTPTFFVGTRKVEGAFPADSFRAIIRQQLAKVKPAK